jgi:hypothetical protein
LHTQAAKPVEKSKTNGEKDERSVLKIITRQPHDEQSIQLVDLPYA